MRKTLLSLMVSAVSFLSFPAHAEGTLYLGYCDGRIATSTSGNITGQVGSYATIAEAIRLTPDQLSACVGSQIVAVNAGLAEASQLPTEITALISYTCGGDTLATGTLAMPEAGWNVINLTTPYTITGQETELWVEFSFVQPKKLPVISFAGTTHPNGCFVGKKGVYTDFSSKGWGSLSVEAIVQGESIPTHDLTILSARTSQSLTQIGNTIRTELTIRNNASAPAVNPVVEYALNGEVKGSFTYQGTLNYREQANLQIEVPTDGITQEGDVSISYALSWGDGQTDENPSDNTYSLTATMAEMVFFRNMVAEEATGSWCGWCIRGIVGMKYMRDNYPQHFIGIGVHASDEYEVANYANWINSQVTGYPSALINRDGKVYDPGSSVFEGYYAGMPAISDVNIDLTVSLVDKSTLNFNTQTTFLRDYEASDFSVAYVVLEDKLPIAQHNYYSGGGAGPMGGYESLGSVVNIDLDDIARAVYPSPAGDRNVIPAQITKKQVYTHDYQVPLPSIRNIQNVWCAVLLIDNATSGVVQAAKTMAVSTAGIHQVAADAPSSAPAFNLQGQPLPTAQRGLQVLNGRVVFMQ